ncbi:uncharacterized protein K452DRAFT_317739 [Aplosporella prunicola CBS 121167]|uniref:Uncharacterized protein n=1 Tax=Aplosporella prunicola CBS 121167 TaxID=1176127 RepID=A0A6A6BJT2_9PEZI|nr:uncharacterized protein K452DRAFT_317739 [Aplosporella prunicola CBS 121167]KAF2142831.1 hypothetical protein K452DRAFT_317739 [Aplosporella prunicola CBS 121167]
MIFGALPSVLQAGKGLAPFVVSLIVLAVGAGLFKPNVAPAILDQYTHQKPYTKVLKSGEKVIVDPEATVQRLMLVFYALVNIGAFFALATTYAEKRIGYWLAYLLPTIIFMFLPLLLLYLYTRVVKVPPSGPELTRVVRICTLAVRENRGKFWKSDFWDSVKPARLSERDITTFRGKPIDWTDRFVDDVIRTLGACKIFLYFPIYNLSDSGIGSVLTNQGSTMLTNGAPNDILINFNPLAIVITIPILTYVIYPLLRKRNIKFGRITRITLGFILASISSALGAVLQYYVYETNPCKYAATRCANDGAGVSPISIWMQIPVVVLGALSECFCNVTGYEIAYARSPHNMKALAVALFLATHALSSAAGEVLSPVIKDPYLIWIWAGPSIALALQTVVFWFKYRRMDNDEFMTYNE